MDSEMTTTREEERECVRCHVVRPLDAYGRDKRTRDGLSTVCKSCRAEARSEREARVKEHLRSWRVQRRARINAEKLQLACSDCGWSPSVETECWQLQWEKGREQPRCYTCRFPNRTRPAAAAGS